MVFLTRFLGYAKTISKGPRKYLRAGFLDKLRVPVKGGTGGSGLSKYGGVGGRGGDIYVRAKDGYTLRDLSKYVKDRTLVGGTGYDSSKKGILGEAGEDLIINVPPGVDVYHENGTFIGSVDKAEKKMVVAMGGAGGCKETDFSGQRGENHAIILDLKLICDVALVGFPNAGKSTLIRSLSDAKPKIAAYPFTTVKPHLGTIYYPDFREILIADLPGLIEGAHKNVGMGHEFLKHLERAKMLLFIVDIQGFQLSAKHYPKTCLESILLLNKEIELYKPNLLDKPAMLVINKMDTKNAEVLCKKFKPYFQNLKNFTSEYSENICPDRFLEFENILTVSLINKDKNQIKMLKDVIRENLDKIKEAEDLQLADEIPEYKLIKKLRKELKLTAPTLL